MPLRRQIWFVTVSVFLLSVVIAFWGGRLTYRQQVMLLEDDAQSMAATIVAYFEAAANSPGGVDMAAAQAMLASIPMPEGSTITVTNQKGVVLARSREPERFVGRVLGDALPKDVPRSSERLGLDGVRRAFGNRVIERQNWLVSVGIPLSTAFARTWPIYRRNAVLISGMLTLIMSVAFVITRRWLRAVTHLESAAVRVAGGDLQPVRQTPMPAREFEQLQTTFAAMVTNLREARAAIDAQVAHERRMREEVESLQRQVVRQERLAAIGVLVSGIAHELNNPLQAIYGFTEVLLARADMPEGARADLAVIEKESARSAAIIRNLARFSRQQSVTPSPVSMRDVVASVVELRQRKFDEQAITLVVEDHARTGALAVFTELQQVLLNFVINAEQSIAFASPPVRRITIRTEDSDGHVRVAVEDTGPGVSAADESKLFQPFFTTKPVGDGTGLGLSVSYGIIQSHGGRIGHERTVTGGARFFFELPAIADSGSSNQAQSE
jgi:C4-dicarboxylate-specific signal transduction histidine kinase